MTFEEVAEKWLAQYEQESRPATVKSVYNRFSLYVEPAAFYRKNIEDVTRADVREVFGKLKKKPQTAKRVFSIYNMIFKYAIGLGYMNGQNPMPESKYLLPTIHEQSRPAIVDDADRFGDILLKIRAQYESGDNCAGMLLFLAYCFTRPGETRRLQWHNVCYKDNLIKLSKEETKSDAPLLIPITRQVHGLLERQKKRRISPIMPNDYIFFAPQKGPKYTMSDALP